MPTADLPHGITLAYDTFGDPADPTLVLINGLGQLRQGWQPEFVDQLVASGLHVLTYDQRDAGGSTHLSDAPTPDPVAVFGGDRSSITYDLSDMAGDLAALLDALDIDTAHVLGTSLGGMVAQVFAARHPQRTRSLTSWMSTPSLEVSRPDREVLAVLMTPPGPTRDDVVAHTLRTYDALAGEGHPIDRDAVAAYGEMIFEAGPDPMGTGRQNLAIVASGDRSDEVATITAPTLVLHGDKDPLMRPVCGEATANLIDGARLVVLEGAGHYMARETWPTVVAEVTDLVRRADA
ncbi:MAG: alpha/beta hydrolase [Dermatophilus congolensis]|nr:alpha/beta hydrolase [Dermatophilus congolensis]